MGYLGSLGSGRAVPLYRSMEAGLTKGQMRGQMFLEGATKYDPLQLSTLLNP